MGLYIKDFSGFGISDGNGINFTVFRTYGGDLRVRNNETGAVFDTVPVSEPHGRLGDLDALTALFMKVEGETGCTACSMEQIYDTLNETSSIIPKVRDS